MAVVVVEVMVDGLPHEVAAEVAQSLGHHVGPVIPRHTYRCASHVARAEIGQGLRFGPDLLHVQLHQVEFTLFFIWKGNLLFFGLSSLNLIN